MTKDQSSPTPKRLYLSSSDKQLSGVCGGLGAYMGIDSTVLRLLWVILTIVTGFIPGAFLYLVAAVVIPREPGE